MARLRAKRYSSTSSTDTLPGIVVDSSGSTSTSITSISSASPPAGSKDASNDRYRADTPSERLGRGLTREDTNPMPDSRTVSGETLVPDINDSQSSLLQEGIHALDLPWNLNTPPTAGTGKSESAMDAAKSPQKKTPAKKYASATNPTRRSSRLSIVQSAGDFTEAASTILGKRSREVLEKGKEKIRSLRPRKSAPEEAVGTFEGPVAKRLRLSEPTVSKPSLEQKPLAPADLPKRKAKRWLNQGLYLGQHRGFDARLTETKNKLKKERKEVVGSQRSMLPLPMFAGERLLKNGRDFNLPFDVFSPLPPGQPKPDEWRKVNKSMQCNRLVIHLAMLM